jgi:phosphatidylglycerol:prolipoprotein diacylglycerol transferase
MKPFLLELPIFGWTLSLPTYGTILAAAFLTALWFALRESRKAGLPRDAILDIWIAALVSGIVGAKVLLYLLDLDYYISHPRAILSSLTSAGVFYGGLAAAILTCAIMVRRRGLPVWRVADVAAPSIALGQAIGRLGCFSAGCCYGRPTSLPWAVTFTDPEAHRLTGVPLNVPLHPSQLYLSMADFALFVVLLVVSRRTKREGDVFLWYLVLYGLMRGALEFTRGDPRGEMLGFSTSQWIALAAALAGAVLMMRSRAAGVPAPARRAAR